jgi:hypothetical protein
LKKIDVQIGHASKMHLESSRHAKKRKEVRQSLSPIAFGTARSLH